MEAAVLFDPEGVLSAPPPVTEVILLPLVSTAGRGPSALGGAGEVPSPTVGVRGSLDEKARKKPLMGASPKLPQRCGPDMPIFPPHPSMCRANSAGSPGSCTLHDRSPHERIPNVSAPCCVVDPRQRTSNLLLLLLSRYPLH